MKREIIYRKQKGVIGLHSDSEYEAREVLLKGTIQLNSIQKSDIMKIWISAS